MTSRSNGRRPGGALLAVAMIAALVSPVLVTTPASAAPGGISTAIGGGAPRDGIGDGLLATRAALVRPWGIATSGSNIFVTSGGPFGPGRVRKVLADGTITTVAGGAPTPVGDGGPATGAILLNPRKAAVDGAGNLYIADSGNNRIRKVATSGTISTVAGTGAPGYGGDGGPATAALLTSPESVAVDGAGNLVIADSGNYRIRKVTASGVITTVAGTGVAGYGGDGGPATAAQFQRVRSVTADGAGNLFFSDLENQRVRKVDSAGLITTVAGTGVAGYSGDGGAATAAQLNFPSGVAVLAGSLAITDEVNHRVRRVDPSGVITTVAGTGTAGFSGDGGAATAAQLNHPTYVSFDGAGNLLVSDSGNHRLRQVTTAGTITTVAGTGTSGFEGDGGPATAARFSGFGDTASDAAGNVYVADVGNARIRRIDTAGVVTTVAGGGVGDGLPAAHAVLRQPRGLAVDGAGNLYIADCDNRRVRKVDASGAISTVAGGGAPADGVGDGGQATAAALRCPSGLAVVTSGTAKGTLYVADALAHRVRRIDPAGVITTVVGTGAAGFNGDGGFAHRATLNGPAGVGFDAGGNLLVADTDNHRVRRVDARTRITTVAGNGTQGYGRDGVAATSVPVTNPIGTVVDGAGNLVVAESRFARVRRITPAGVISTLAGLGVPGLTGDGGPAASATVDIPTNAALDAAGHVLFTDRANDRVRRVEAGSPAPLPNSGCGRLVTESITLTRNLGPCPGDGLVVGADNVTIDLNGFSIFGRSSPEGTNIGVRLVQRNGVVVKGGTVTGFDAGVAVIGGSGNTFTALTLRDNLGPRALDVALFSDGIVFFFSSDNTVSGNVITNNGSYDGLGIYGIGADRNLVQGNVIERTPMRGEFGTVGTGMIITPFIGFSLPRGVSLFGNRVINNTIRDNENSGISNLSNVGGEISGNTVTGNGLGREAFPGNGIGVQRLTQAINETNTLVQANQVHGNGGYGIFVSSRSNQILDNDASGNHVVPALEGNDLFDAHPDCDSNVWLRNVWGSGGFSPACVTTGGQAAAGTTTVLAASEPPDGGADATPGPRPRRRADPAPTG